MAPENENGHHGIAAWERATAVVVGGCILGIVAYLIVRNQPFNDPNLVVLTRIILSLATALLGATLPGFLNVKWNLKGVSIRAGGALALFTLTLIATPKVLPIPVTNIAPFVDQMQKLNDRFNSLQSSLNAKSLLIEETKAISELYDKKQKLRDEWRELYNQYSDLNRTNYYGSAFIRQTIGIKMGEIVQQLESINGSLSQLEQKARTNYVEIMPPLPPGGLKVVGSSTN